MDARRSRLIRLSLARSNSGPAPRAAARPTRGRPGGEALGRLDARDEALSRPAELELRDRRRASRDVHRREEHVAQLRRAAALAGRPSRSPSARASSSSRSASAPADVRVLEADRRRAPLHLPRLAAAPAATPARRGRCPRALLVALDPLPVLADAPGRLRLDVTEDVRVAPHELLVDRRRDLLEVALARSSSSSARK